LLRGGGFGVDAMFVRSAYRFRSSPARRDLNFGFRPARTIR
jgi:formylglycine-generating enzyme required for sulfatase activity